MYLISKVFRTYLGVLHLVNPFYPWLCYSENELGRDSKIMKTVHKAIFFLRWPVTDV